MTLQATRAETKALSHRLERTGPAQDLALDHAFNGAFAWPTAIFHCVRFDPGPTCMRISHLDGGLTGLETPMAMFI
jgi:hypothetical protein